jgi:predicted PP-loop superfamily ATPase
MSEKRNHKIKTFVVGDSLYSLNQLLEILRETNGDFEIFAALNQDALKRFDEMKREKGDIDLITINFCDSANSVELVRECFKRGSSAFPTILCAPSISEVESALKNYLRMNEQYIIYLQEGFGEDEFRGALKRALPRIKLPELG